MIFSPPTLITAAHQVSDFDCGVEALNLYLQRFALVNSAAGVAKTYVTTVTEKNSVIGYFSLAAGSVEKATVSARVGKGIPNHPAPVILLARLAADLRFQGQGIGKGMLREALQRAAWAADVIGVRAVLVHAKDKRAASFYAKYGFAPSPIDPLLMMLLMKDLKRALGVGS